MSHLGTPFPELIEVQELKREVERLKKAYRAWKQVAKNRRKEAIDNEGDLSIMRSMYLEEQRTASRHLDLLRRWNNQTHRCVFCNGWLTWIGDEAPRKKGHQDDCELAREINANQKD